MGYGLIRLVYSIYICVSLFILVVTLSRLLFSNTPKKLLLQNFVIGLIWPIALFSQAGRAVIRDSLSLKK